MSSVQIFGIRKSAATRAAERFFKERRSAVQFVDLAHKPIAPGEIRRFIERFGFSGLLDTEGKAYADAGLKYLKLTDTELLERIQRDPALLRLPLVRSGNRISIGQDTDAWESMLNPPSNLR